MSSVGSSDSSNASRTQEETIRKTREAASTNESELVKKHQRELRRISEEHYAEVENLNKAHQAQMNDLRKTTGSDVSERDHKYQQEIEDLRGLYHKQLQDQANESQRRDEGLRKANTGDLNTEKAHAEQRFEKLNEDYGKGRIEQEHSFGDALKENRETQKNTIEDNRDKLARQYELEAKSLKDERNMRVGGLQKGYDDYRQSAEARSRDQDLRHFQDQERSSANLLRAVQKERLGRRDSEEVLRDGFKDGLEQTRERFEKAASNEREAGHVSREQMKSTVGDRIENQVTRLEHDKEDLKDGNIRQELKMKQKQRREIADITDSYQKNMDNYKEQRDEAVRSSNDRTHKDVQKVRKELDGQAVETNRFYRMEEAEQNQIHRSAYDNLKGDFELRNEQSKSTADKRVKNLYEQTAEDKARMSELQVENHTASQHSHQDDMKALRANLEADKQIAVNNLQERLQRQELQHSDRMSQVVAKYEKQLQTLKDQMTHEKKSGDDNLKRSVEEMQRQHKLSVDQMATQTRDRLRMVDAHHSEELRSVNKRNDEKMDQVIGELKKT